MVDENSNEQVLDENTEQVVVDENVVNEVLEEVDLQAALKAEVANLEDKLKRNLAEFDNFRKRTIKEKSAINDDAVRSTIEKLLPVLDNLERALEPNDSTETSSLQKGIDMTLKQFKETLKTLGVEEIDAKDKGFNPDLHLAVMHIEDEAYASNVVVDVLQKGYTYKEKVIRYATVKVAN
jgi:molecular chaperone GrpE